MVDHRVGRSRARFSYRVPSRVAAIVGGAQLIALAAVRTSGIDIPIWLIVALTLLISGVCYAATHFVANVVRGRRLERAIHILEQVGQRDFSALDDSAAPPARRWKRADKLDELERAILRAGHTLRQEIENLQTIESYRKDFLGNVSHELKTPLFSIRGFTETLLDGAVERPEVRTEFLQKILRNSDRLANLASDLSEISKIETGELKMKRAPFQMADLIMEVVEEVEPIAQLKKVTLEVVLTERLLPVIGDEERIRQVLVNLVDNGVKYTNEHGRVTVAATMDQASVRVSVSDDGIGVSDDHIHRLTERFYRVDASRSRSQGGTGLGLAIVKHILSAHGQPLLIQSEVNRGSAFSFSLPIATSDAVLA